MSKINIKATIKQNGKKEEEIEATALLENNEITYLYNGIATILDIKEPKVFSVSDDFQPDRHFVTIEMITTKYSGRLKTMEPEKEDKWEWFELDNLPEKIYSPSKKFIEKYTKEEFNDILKEVALGEIIDRLVRTDDGYRNVSFETFDSKQFGRIRPMDVQ